MAAWTTAALRLQLIQVDHFVGFFATGIEVIVHKLDNLNTRNASGLAEGDGLMHATFDDLRVAKNLLNGLQGTTE